MRLPLSTGGAAFPAHFTRVGLERLEIAVRSHLEPRSIITVGIDGILQTFLSEWRRTMTAALPCGQTHLLTTADWTTLYCHSLLMRTSIVTMSKTVGRRADREGSLSDSSSSRRTQSACRM